MEKLLEAIKNGDLIKTQREFNECMKPVIASIIESRFQKIAKSVVVEGEEPEDDEDDEDDEDENEEHEDDENADDENEGKGKEDKKDKD